MDTIKHIVFKENKTTTTPWIFLSLNIILFITFSAIAFYHNVMYLFYTTDGHYMLTLLREDHVWRSLDFGLTNNFLQSNGDISFPMNTMFFPGFVIASFINDVLYSQVTAYVFFAFEFFLIGMLVARIVGLSWNLTMIAAWLLPLVAYPYYYYAVLYNIMETAPQLGTIVATTDLIIILFVYVGRNTLFKSLLYSALIALLLTFIMIANPPAIILSAPIIAILCATDLIFCGSLREIKLKLAFAAGILIFSIPLLIYLYSLMKFSVSYYLAYNLNYGSHTISWYHISILFHGLDKLETKLFIMGLLGVIFCSFFGNTLRKSIARGVLTAIVIILGFGIIAVHYSFWTGPMPLYFEFMLWPFYISYGVMAVGMLLTLLTKGLTLLFSSLRQVNTNIIVRPLILLTPFYIFHWANPIGDCWNVPKSPNKSPIVEVLNNEISLFPGKQFQGRVVNFTGLKMDRPIAWNDLLANDNGYLFKSGNDHRLNGLWFYNIPTLEIYNPIISPTYFKLATSLFALPMDEQIRTVIVMRQPNVRWLETLGVKFVITDLPLKMAKQRKIMVFPEQGKLYLYELANPNLGQYSPTKVIELNNLDAILAKLKDKKFNPQSDIVTDTILPNKIVKANDVKLFADKGFVTVTASSVGNSIILLPLEFSHCLSIKSHDAKEDLPIMFRANLVQTGVLFHRTLNASIRYFTGPFKNSTCRLKDAKDFEKLSSK